jgi:hypothetical protein
MTATAEETTTATPEDETSADAASEAPSPVSEPAPEDVPDLDVILPEGGRVTIGGIECQIARIKFREFMLLMRVITNGLGQSIKQFRLDPSNPDELQENLVAMVVLAVPNALEEFSYFLLSIVRPVADSDRAALGLALENPEADEMLDVLGILVEQEKDDLVTGGPTIRSST